MAYAAQSANTVVDGPHDAAAASVRKEADSSAAVVRGHISLDVRALGAPSKAVLRVAAVSALNAAAEGMMPEAFPVPQGHPVTAVPTGRFEDQECCSIDVCTLRAQIAELAPLRERLAMREQQIAELDARIAQQEAQKAEMAATITRIEAYFNEIRNALSALGITLTVSPH